MEPGTWNMDGRGRKTVVSYQLIDSLDLAVGLIAFSGSADFGCRVRYEMEALA